MSEFSPTHVVVIGAGGHAAELCSYVPAIAARQPGLRLLGCVDDHKPVGRNGVVTIIGDVAHLEQLFANPDQPSCITALGDNPTRRALVARVEALDADTVDWWTLRHPAAIVGPDVEIGEGTCVAPGVIITTRARIGRHCILNVNVSVSHDAIVGDFCNVNPGAIIAGNVRIGAGCYIGAGATIIDKVTVGPGTIVGAGAAVVDDLPPNVTAVGVPARVIKRHAAAWELGVVPRRA